jgi:hypothetical protein
MDFLWHINYEEMLSGLIVTSFIILLNAAVVVVCSMVMFPLIDLAFKKKAKPAPTPTPIETWQHDDLTAPAWLAGRPWLAMRSDYLQPDALPHPPLAAEGMAQHAALAHPQLEHITPFIIRPLMQNGSEGAQTGSVTAPSTPLASNYGRSSKSLSSEDPFSKGRPDPPVTPKEEEPAPSRAA